MIKRPRMCRKMTRQGCPNSRIKKKILGLDYTTLRDAGFYVSHAALWIVSVIPGPSGRGVVG